MMLKLQVPVSRVCFHTWRLLRNRSFSLSFKSLTTNCGSPAVGRSYTLVGLHSPSTQSSLRSLSTNPHSDTSSSSITSSSSSNLPPHLLTTGQIWHHLQREKIGKDKDISISEWSRLVTSTQPNTPSEARLIRTALLDLNRCCPQFKLTRDMAKDAVEGIMRSMMPTSNSSWKKAVEAGIFLGQTVVQQPTGLHVAVETAVLDQYLFQHLYTCLQQEEGGEENSKELYPKILEVTTGVLHLLWERCSKPMKKMKKRAARKYKNKLSCTQGPSPQTIDWAVQICIEIQKRNDGVQGFVDPYPLAVQMVQELESRTWLGPPREETKRYLTQYAATAPSL